MGYGPPALPLVPPARHRQRQSPARHVQRRTAPQMRRGGPAVATRIAGDGLYPDGAGAPRQTGNLRESQLQPAHSGATPAQAGDRHLPEPGGGKAAAPRATHRSHHRVCA